MSSSAGGAGSAQHSPISARRTLLVLVAIMAAGLLLRLHGLTRTSLWLDEGFSVQIAVLERERFLDILLSDTQPPLYYAALMGWTLLFGTGEFAIRLLGVVIGVLTLPVVFAIGRLVAGPRIALLATALLATSSLHIHYSTEVRMYALLILFGAIAIFGGVLFATSPGDAQAQRHGVAAFAGGAIGAAWTQVAGVFMLPGLALLMLAGWWFRGRPAGMLRRFVVAQCLVIGALALSAPLFLRLAANAATLTSWIPPVSPRIVAELVGSLVGQRLGTILPLPVAGVAVAGLLAVAAHGAWTWRRRALPFLFAALVGALPFLLTIVVSLLSKPIFMLRVHLWALIPLYLLIAAALVDLLRRRRGVLVAGFVVAMQVLALYAYHVEWRRPEWREAIAVIAADYQPGDVILVPRLPGAAALVAYYAPPLAPAIERLGRAEEIAALPARLVRSRLWLLSAPRHDRVPADEAAEALAPSHAQVSEQLFYRMAVRLFVPRVNGAAPR